MHGRNCVPLAALVGMSWMSPATLTAAPLTVADLSPGDLLVTEYLADPVNITDADAEYFEIYNSRTQDVDLTDLVIRDDGSNQFTVSGLVVGAGELAVFSSSDGSALGITPDYVYGGAMSLTNGDDEIVLVGAGDSVIHRLQYGDGDAFGDGIAHELVSIQPGSTSASGPGLGDDFVAATQALADGNFGSPGSLGGTLPPVPVPPAAWLFGSALGALLGLRKRAASQKKS